MPWTPPPGGSPAEEVGFARPKAGRPQHAPLEHEPTKAGSEALDLRLDRLRHVALPAVRDMAVGPRGVLPLGRARRVEEGVLGEQDERRRTRTAAPRGPLRGRDL